jgi:hypothetical protein
MVPALLTAGPLCSCWRSGNRAWPPAVAASAAAASAPPPRCPAATGRRLRRRLRAVDMQRGVSGAAGLAALGFPLPSFPSSSAGRRPVWLPGADGGGGPAGERPARAVVESGGQALPGWPARRRSRPRCRRRWARWPLPSCRWACWPPPASCSGDLRQSGRRRPTPVSSAGLQRVLQESTLALLRHPDLWVYANAEAGSGAVCRRRNPPSTACR